MDTRAPQCVGFIMDGNRRWAELHGKTSLEGHAEGYRVLKEIIRATPKHNIPHIVCYAFSTENWKRTESEVAYLMQLLQHALTELRETLVREGKKMNLRIIGERDCLPEFIQAEIAKNESLAVSDPDLTLWLAISYGGRAEIVHAVNEAIQRGEHVTEESFTPLLWTSAMPDPDIIIRTSGEQRMSNFLLWQSAYSELFFTPTLWPDFGEREFQSILEEYAKRSRRKGA